jgi:hypothetical protein
MDDVLHHKALPDAVGDEVTQGRVTDLFATVVTAANPQQHPRERLAVMAIYSCELATLVTRIFIGGSEHIESHERHSARVFCATRPCSSVQMGKIIVIENPTVRIELVIHQIVYADVIVLHTTDPKAIMA